MGISLRVRIKKKKTISKRILGNITNSKKKIF